MKKILMTLTVLIIFIFLTSCNEKPVNQESAIPTNSEESSVEPTHQAKDYAKIFLYDYTSLFTEIDYEYKYSEKEGYDKPIFYDPVSSLPIENVPYIIFDNLLIAYDFSLYDFDYDGVAEIIIFFGQPNTCYIVHKIYKFSDGEYKEIHESYANQSFYTDSKGRILLYLCDEMNGVFGCYYFKLNGDTIEFETIIDENFFNHITGEQLDIEDFCNFNGISIPGMPGEVLKKYAPLDKLKEEIKKSVTEKLKEDGKIR